MGDKKGEHMKEYNFKAYEPRQLYILPPSINEWVPDESLARYVSDVVEHFEEEGKLKRFYEEYRDDGWGAWSYHPRMMVKVLLYAYCHGVTSSRKIAAALEDNVAFRYLSGNQQPDFRTVSDFRKQHLEGLKGLFVEILRLCQEAGLVKLGRVALDGRKVACNAALSGNRTKEGLAKELKGLEKEILDLMEEADCADAEEDKLYGRENRGDELPADLRNSEERRKRLKEAYDRLEQKEQEERGQQEKKIAERAADESAKGCKKRGRKPKETEEVVDHERKANMTDPDSRILKGRKGYIQGYNGQAIADCKSQVIVGQDVTQDENDRKQLEPMLERCKEQAGRSPAELLADSGYWSEKNAALESEETELFISTQKDWKQRKAIASLDAPRGRIPKSATVQELMERKLLTQRGKSAYKQRGSTIEPVFGQMSLRGLNRIWVRGIEMVKLEWSMWCGTHNLLKLWRSGRLSLARAVT